MDRIIFMIQPLFSLTNNKVKGGEILIQSTFGGAETTLGILEKQYSKQEIDKFIVSKALQFLSNIDNKHIDTLCPLHINITRDTLLDIKSVDHIIQLIKQFKLESKIMIEIHEETDLNNTQISENIHRIIENSIMISLDDANMATGSIHGIANYGIKELKLKQTGLGEFTSKDIIILKNICDELQIELVIEGIETLTQLEVLRSLKIDMIQGYVCSIPLLMDSYIEELRCSLTIKELIKTADK